jgi:hypothetical protein
MHVLNDCASATYRKMYGTIMVVKDTLREQVYGIYRTNSFSLGDAGEAGGRHGMFPTVSRANHSCLPNCFVGFHETEAVSLPVCVVTSAAAHLVES